MLSGEFEEEARFLDAKHFIMVRIEEVRPVYVDTFFKLTERGKKEAAKIQLRMSR